MRRRSALPITLTDGSAVAAAAMIGDCGTVLSNGVKQQTIPKSRIGRTHS